MFECIIYIMWNSCLIAFTFRLQCILFKSQISFGYDSLSLRFKRITISGSIWQISCACDLFLANILNHHQEAFFHICSSWNNPIRCFESYSPLELWQATRFCMWLIVSVRTCLAKNAGKCFHDNDKTWMQFY